VTRYLGYADIDGAYPGHPLEVEPWTNLYIAWSFVGYFKSSGETIDQWLPRMVNCVDRAVFLGFKIYVGLDMGRKWANHPDDFSTRKTTVRRILTALAPYRASVVAIDVSDEMCPDKETAKAWYVKVRDVMADLGYGSIPIGMTFTATQATQEDIITIPLASSAGMLKGPDFVTLELYAGPNGKNLGETGNMDFIRGNIDASVARIDPRIKVAFWLQGFNRNGVFVGEDELATLNKQSYKFARDKHHSDGEPLNPSLFLIFNWARTTGPGKVGTKWLPKVIQKHKWIATDMGVIA